MSKYKLAILASGSGTNAEAIMGHFQTHGQISVELLISNNPNAYALERARKFHVPTIVVTRAELSGETFAASLAHRGVTHLVLAGFLLLMPPSLVNAYAGRIINIHPALLPKYGGKGMYGEHVHKAVIAASDIESGISIHEVNEQYDDGEVIFQARCPVDPSDDHMALAAKIHHLEHRYYPMVIERWILQEPMGEL